MLSFRLLPWPEIYRALDSILCKIFSRFELPSKVISGLRVRLGMGEGLENGYSCKVISWYLNKVRSLDRIDSNILFAPMDQEAGQYQ